MFEYIKKWANPEPMKLTTGVSFKSWGQDISNSLKSDDLTWGTHDFLKANQISLYLNRAIEKRAESVGTAQWFLVNKAGEEIYEHEALDFINQPNKFHNGDKFWSLYQKYLDLSGSAYIFKETEKVIFEKDKNKELHLLRPDLVKVLIQDGREITGFEYNRANGGKVNYTSDQVVYAFKPSPLSPLTGEPLVQSGVRAIDTDIQISQYHSRILKNGGSVDLLFTIKDIANLDEEQTNQLKRQFKEKHAGALNAKEPMFVGNDVGVERIGLTPQELDFLEAKKMTLDDISILTGVPKAILSNYSELKFDNAKVATMTFKRDTVKPMLEDLREVLNKNFAPEGFKFDFEDPVPEDVEEFRATLKVSHEVGALTLNEKREMLGYDPLEGGDELPKSPTAKPEEPREEVKEVKKKAKIKNPLEGNRELQKAYGMRKVKVMNKEEDKFAKQVRRFFKAQKKRILEKYGEGAKIGEVFEEKNEIDLTREFFEPLILEALKAGGQASEEVTKSIITKFNLTDLAVSWVASRSLQMARDVTHTTKESLNALLVESIGENLARREVVKKIEELYTGFDTNRALTIARTETHGAIEKGTLENYRQAGLESKIWVTTFENSRDDHMSADGQKRPIDMPFSVGGESLDMPGDASGSAGNVINCQCTI